MILNTSISVFIFAFYKIIFFFFFFFSSICCINNSNASWHFWISTFYQTLFKWCIWEIFGVGWGEIWRLLQVSSRICFDAFAVYVQHALIFQIVVFTYSFSVITLSLSVLFHSNSYVSLTFSSSFLFTKYSFVKSLLIRDELPLT